MLCRHRGCSGCCFLKSPREALGARSSGRRTNCRKTHPVHLTLTPAALRGGERGGGGYSAQHRGLSSLLTNTRVSYSYLLSIYGV